MSLQVISVVTAPADSYDLVTLEDVHQNQDIPDGDTNLDSFISASITRASTAIQTYCARQFAVETITDSFYPQRDNYPWQVPGNIGRINLSRWPVTEISSVVSYFDLNNPQTLIAGTDYLANNVTGQIIRLEPNAQYPTIWESARIVVVYQAGYAEIPYDVQDACLRMVSSSMQGRARDPMVKSITEQGVTTEYWVDLGKDGNFPPQISQLLDAYRVPVAR